MVSTVDFLREIAVFDSWGTDTLAVWTAIPESDPGTDFLERLLVETLAETDIDVRVSDFKGYIKLGSERLRNNQFNFLCWFAVVGFRDVPSGDGHNGCEKERKE